MEPFRLEVPQADLDDLHRRLDATRWPPALGGEDGWALGAPSDDLRALADHWRDGFDWRAVEAELNAFDQLTTTIDGTRVHAVHARSPHAEAEPLLFLHGWPGSVVEVLDIVGPLTAPDDAADAFHVVAPSLPGFGLSGPTPDAGWTIDRMADAFAELLDRLGYDRFGVQGGDWGSAIAMALGRRHPDRVTGVHVNLVMPDGPQEVADDPLAAESLRHYRSDLSGYSIVNAQRPASLAYALTDSPVGQLAWIAERFHDWTDPATRVGRDRILADVSLYWFTRTAGSSAALYHETKRAGSARSGCTEVPVGVAMLPHEIHRATREHAEATHRIVHWTAFERGGHFAALEVPDALVADVRAFFARR